MKSNQAPVITSVTPGTFAELGLAKRGRVNEEYLTTSYSRWAEEYGGFMKGAWSTYCAYAFFMNDGHQLYYNRVVLPGATKALINVTHAATAAEFIGRPIPNQITLGGTPQNIKLAVDALAASTIDVVDGGIAGDYALEDIVDTINATLLATGTCSLVSDVTGYGRLKFVSATASAISRLTFSLPAIADITTELLGLDVTVSVIFAGTAASALWTCTAYSEGTWGNGLRLTYHANDNYGNDLTGWTKFDIKLWDTDDDGVIAVKNVWEAES